MNRIQLIIAKIHPVNPYVASVARYTVSPSSAPQTAHPRENGSSGLSILGYTVQGNLLSAGQKVPTLDRQVLLINHLGYCHSTVQAFRCWAMDYTV